MVIYKNAVVEVEYNEKKRVNQKNYKAYTIHTKTGYMHQQTLNAALRYAMYLTVLA